MDTYGEQCVPSADRPPFCVILVTRWPLSIFLFLSVFLFLFLLSHSSVSPHLFLPFFLLLSFSLSASPPASSLFSLLLSFSPPPIPFLSFPPSAFFFPPFLDCLTNDLRQHYAAYYNRVHCASLLAQHGFNKKHFEYKDWQNKTASEVANDNEAFGEVLHVGLSKVHSDTKLCIRHY